MNIITTEKKWNDVLPATSVKLLMNLLDECVQKKQSATENKNQQPLCSLLFYGGSPEKRKAAAALSGMHTSKQVYRIDTTAIVSKYIGETEKNLKTVFDKSAENNQVLFFDEADALFGKRTDVKDSHDKYANLLVEHMQTHPGIVILSTNDKEKLVPSLLDHFNSVIHFPD